MTHPAIEIKLKPMYSTADGSLFLIINPSELATASKKIHDETGQWPDRVIAELPEDGDCAMYGVPINFRLSSTITVHKGQTVGYTGQPKVSKKKAVVDSSITEDNVEQAASSVLESAKIEEPIEDKLDKILGDGKDDDSAPIVD